jgi:DNA-binding transcriptional ArsR family regulator
MDDIDKLSNYYKALADPTRLRLIKLLTGQSTTLCNGGCGGQTFLCVGALAQQLGVTQSAVSQHLRILRQAGIVRAERRGAFVHYSLDREEMKKFRSMAAQLLEKSTASR